MAGETHEEQRVQHWQRHRPWAQRAVAVAGKNLEHAQRLGDAALIDYWGTAFGRATIANNVAEQMLASLGIEDPGQLDLTA